MNYTASQNAVIKTISILGCGWFGFALAKKLIALNYIVKGSTTTPEKLPILAEEKIQPYLISFSAENIIADPVFFKTDVLFICIPPKRNSTEFKAYPDKIKAILTTAEHRTANIVLISSTSVYGDTNETVNENTDPCPDTDSGRIILEAEELIKANHSFSTTVIRFAGLIGPNRNPGKFFAGKKEIPNGLAPVNLIHQTDAVGIACKIIEKQAFGKTYNACAAEHPLRKDFYTNEAKISGLSAPEFVMEKTNWKVVESVNIPAFLGYEFEISL
ncbi:NAD(P)-binding domain-containing protein [Pedobacter punctiformis]|uniref:NAD(P)-binding domain-containing protein n=1 Tax=Pedobacter punctiformis TaxID=3004097 RepID=A0ABT4L9M8_9SPHI|nr:NAD(P)-binding domain-containing protein [Pedobacter sp. HCMS5-2]MCZ4244600.1 NAD(P)-binding domain-containing protein [Pedobacter sp. HCMS5-2]